MEKPTFKFESTIDLSNQAMAQALIHFIATVSEVEVNSVSEVQNLTPTPPAESIKPAKNVFKEKNEAAKAEKPEKAEKAEKPEKPVESEEKTQPGDGSDDEVNFDMVRSAMASKVEDHRAEIKKQMESYGAKNISSLPEDKYAEFYQFLKDL